MPPNASMSVSEKNVAPFVMRAPTMECQAKSHIQRCEHQRLTVKVQAFWHNTEKETLDDRISESSTAERECSRSRAALRLMRPRPWQAWSSSRWLF
eukprot:scaffold44388_cov63-Phaeocystis_antarctica.AAC.1